MPSWHQRGRTYIFADDGAQALDPENARAAELADEESLAGEHRLAEALRLVVFHDTSRTREERILARAPSLLAREADISDIAKRRRGEQQLSRTRESRRRHLAARHELLHAELDRALERHRGRHGDHGAGLGLQRAADGELDRDDGVAVAVADAVAAAVEGAHVVDGGAGAGEVALRRGAARHGRLSAGVVGAFGLLGFFLRVWF